MPGINCRACLQFPKHTATMAIPWCAPLSVNLVQPEANCIGLVPQRTGFCMPGCMVPSAGRWVQDIMVLMQAPVAPLSFLRAKIIGAMRTIDGTVDDKIIAVAADDPEFNHINELSELPEHRWTEIRSFFESYKNGEDLEQPVRTLPWGPSLHFLQAFPAPYKWQWRCSANTRVHNRSGSLVPPLLTGTLKRRCPLCRQTPRAPLQGSGSTRRTRSLCAPAPQASV